MNGRMFLRNIRPYIQRWPGLVWCVVRLQSLPLLGGGRIVAVQQRVIGLDHPVLDAPAQLRRDLDILRIVT